MPLTNITKTVGKKFTRIKTLKEGMPNPDEVTKVVTPKNEMGRILINIFNKFKKEKDEELEGNK